MKKLIKNKFICTVIHNYQLLSQNHKIMSQVGNTAALFSLFSPNKSIELEQIEGKRKAAERPYSTVEIILKNCTITLKA